MSLPIAPASARAPGRSRPGRLSGLALWTIAGNRDDKAVRRLHHGRLARLQTEQRTDQLFRHAFGRLRPAGRLQCGAP